MNTTATVARRLSAPAASAAPVSVLGMQTALRQVFGDTIDEYVFHDPETAATVAVFMNTSNTQSGEHPADQLFRRIAALLEE